MEVAALSATASAYWISPLQELAASLGDALLVTVQTSGSGAVALYAGNCDSLNLIPASVLCSLDSFLAAQCSCVLVAGTYEGKYLGSVDVGVNSDDRIALASDQGLNRSACSGAITNASYAPEFRSVSIMFCCSS